MTLTQLIRFVKHIRETEGVCWNLVDQSPLAHRRDMYTLYAFDDNDVLVAEVRHIEDRDHGKIPKELLSAIAEARNRAGINKMFKRQKPLPDGTTHEQLFEQAKQAWLNQGYFEFMSGSYQVA